MATIGKPVTLVNPGKRKRLTVLQKLHFGTARQRAAAKARLSGKRHNPTKYKRIGANRKEKRSRSHAQQEYHAKRRARRLTRRFSGTQQNVGEIITIRPLTNSGTVRIYKKKRRTTKVKNMARKSSKRRLAGLKAARTRKRRMSARRSSHRTNPGHRRRSYRRRRAVTNYAAPRRRRSHRRRIGNPGVRRRRRGGYRNPGMLTGDFGTALQIIAGAFVTNFAAGFLPSGLNSGVPGYIAIALIAMLQGKAVGKLLKNPRLGNNMVIGGYVYLAVKIANDFFPSLGLGLSGMRGLGIIGPSSFWTPQVPVMGSMGNFVQPGMLRGAIASAAPPQTATGMRGLGSVRRIGRMR